MDASGKAKFDISCTCCPTAYGESAWLFDNCAAVRELQLTTLIGNIVLHSCVHIDLKLDWQNRASCTCISMKL
jgi:hypothetical protein